MSQALHINLDGGELPLHLLSPGTDPATGIVRLDAADVELALLARGMVSGAHSVALFAKLPDGRLAMLEMSAKNFLNAAGAVRGRLAYLGIIPTTVNPGLAIAADREKGLIHFALETPLQAWDYTPDHAKRFWRMLREFTQGM